MFIPSGVPGVIAMGMEIIGGQILNAAVTEDPFIPPRRQRKY